MIDVKVYYLTYLNSIMLMVERLTLNEKIYFKLENYEGECILVEKNTFLSYLGTKDIVKLGEL